MKVGVVIPCYNHFGTLERAINSAFLFADTVQVVIDGGVSRYASYLPDNCDFTLLDGRVGVVGARNIGIELLRRKGCELIVPLDADDYFTVNGLRALVNAWKAGTWVYGGYEIDGQPKRPPPPAQLPRKNVTQATLCFHIEDFFQVGGYDPDFNIGAEDWALTAALTQNGVQGVRIPDVVYHYSPGGERAKRCQRYSQFIAALLQEKYPEVFYAQSPRI